MKTNTYNKIEAYLNGEMTADEKMIFEQEIEKKDELSEMIKLYKMADEISKKEERIKFIENIDRAEKWYFSKQKRILKFGGFGFDSRYLAYAAIFVVLLVTTGLLLLDHLSHTKTKDLYLEFYTPYTEIIELRHSGSEETQFKSGMLAFQNGNYQKAITHFKKLQESNQVLAAFYIAMAYMQLKNYTEAIQYLQKITPTSEYQPEAQWYLSLAYLANGNTGKARELLRVISNEPRHYYNREAKSLLEQLPEK